MKGYETVCGLEIHVELSTKSKMFCGCSTAFGGEPNTQCCPVCTGMPGTLPVLNRQVVEFALITGLALGCEVSRHTRFDRKNYFYPDLPKSFQISQHFFPICRGGGLEIRAEGFHKTVCIHEIHMEEDAGKLLHDPWDDTTLIDYNRSGVPLLEIVTEPDLRGAGEVVAFLEKLREILLYLGVSDCKMQEGSVRADLNLSVRKAGECEYGVRTEIKNMSSLKAIHRAVHAEAGRQIALLESGGTVVQETRRWDDKQGGSHAMRSKENAPDYRFFPEPDLLPLEIGEEWIRAAADAVPELAEAKRRRYRREFGLSEYDAGMLTSSREIAAVFESAAEECGSPKETANLMMTELMRMMNETATLPEDLTIDPGKIAAIVRLILDGTINRGVAKTVLERVFLEDADPVAYVGEHGLAMLDDADLIAEAVDKVLAGNPRPVEDYREGKKKAFGFLVGRTMWELDGKADPQAVNRMLRERLDS